MTRTDTFQKLSSLFSLTFFFLLQSCFFCFCCVFFFFHRVLEDKMMFLRLSKQAELKFKNGKKKILTTFYKIHFCDTCLSRVRVSAPFAEPFESFRGFYRSLDMSTPPIFIFSENSFWFHNFILLIGIIFIS